MKNLLSAIAIVVLMGAAVVSSLARPQSPNTLAALQKVGLAAGQYANDYDGNVVLTQQSAAAIDRPWAVLLQPYLPGQAPYFDPARAAITTPKVPVNGTEQPWYRMTSLSINDSGYSGRYVTLGGTCAGKLLGYTYGVRTVAAKDRLTGVRNLGTMEDEGSRVAFAPTVFGGTPYGYSFFRSFQAARPLQTSVAAFSWSNMVYDTRTLYAGGRIPVVHADGSAGYLDAGDFKPQTEKTAALATAAYCKWMDAGGKRTWGAAWSGS